MGVNGYNAEMDLPGDLVPTARALEALAERERATAPAALEDRVFGATRGSLARAVRPVGRGRPAPRAVVRRIGWLAGARLAAAVAIVGALGAVWLGQMRSPVAAVPSESARGLERDVELLLALRNTGTALEGMSEAIDLLQLNADVISDSLDPAWPTTFDDGAAR
jgi:hypothetical protein